MMLLKLIQLSGNCVILLLVFTSTRLMHNTNHNTNTVTLQLQPDELVINGEWKVFHL
uniref:Uncharacterized protein n=1 Tax=Anguilla anguilla TaxID=7936 RepID=A0A0E9WDD4_ANGAN